jgi:hypothetical protein
VNVELHASSSGYSEGGINTVEKMVHCGEAKALADIEMLFRCFIGFIKSVKWDKENVYSAERHAFIAFTLKGF